MLHPVERRIDMEIELRNDAKLIMLHITQLESDGLLVVHHLLEHSFSALGGEDAQIDVRDAQVRRHAHLTDGDEQVANTFGITKEDVAQIFLHQAGDFLLSGSLHKFLNWLNASHVHSRERDMIRKTRERRRSSFPYSAYS